MKESALIPDVFLLVTSPSHRPRPARAVGHMPQPLHLGGQLPQEVERARRGRPLAEAAAGGALPEPDVALLRGAGKSLGVRVTLLKSEWGYIFGEEFRKGVAGSFGSRQISILCILCLFVFLRKSVILHF